MLAVPGLLLAAGSQCLERTVSYPMGQQSVLLGAVGFCSGPCHQFGGKSHGNFSISFLPVWVFGFLPPLVSALPPSISFFLCMPSSLHSFVIIAGDLFLESRPQSCSFGKA